MGSRRIAREFALQALYEIEMKESEPKLVFSKFWKASEIAGQEIQEEEKAFTLDLVEGTFRNCREIDQLIEKFSHHWKMARMAVVDRNILRLATYELLYRHDIPTSVVLNEAVDIAKKFGTEDSGSFINGILDKIAHTVRKKDDHL